MNFNVKYINLFEIKYTLKTINSPNPNHTYSHGFCFISNKFTYLHIQIHNKKSQTV